ncbi:MAG: RluA family pseudouridine synthase [Isosphaeraceae bacterium]
MIEVLYEDNHCLVLNKPAGLLAQGDETGEASALDLAREYVRTKYNKPGNVYLGLVHRLDRPTSGVLLLARTSKAAARLSEQFREGTVRKVYWAVVEGRCPYESGDWVDTLRKDGAENVVSVVPEGTPGGRLATLGFRVLERTPSAAWLEVRPTTGRGHQIRVQLASRGLPILGDRKYGGAERVLAADGKPRIGLHARELSFQHPTRPEEVSVTAPVPEDWPWPPAGARPGRRSS